MENEIRFGEYPISIIYSKYVSCVYDKNHRFLLKKLTFSKNSYIFIMSKAPNNCSKTY